MGLPRELIGRLSAYIDQHYIVPPKAQHLSIQRMETDSCEMAMPIEKHRAPCASASFGGRSLKDMLKLEDAGFTETLLRLIDETGLKDSQIYKKANISKQHFSKIRNNPHYRPTKATAIALALALELDMEKTKDLIGRAGYALTNSSKFDLIIRYFIECGEYDIIQINMALYEFDQPILGA